MKKVAMLLLLGSTSVWAQPTYRELPSPDCRLVPLGKRTVIYDGRGFFVGYYAARPAAAPAYVPIIKPEGLYTGRNGEWSSVFSKPYMPPKPKEEPPQGTYWRAWLDGKAFKWVPEEFPRPRDPSDWD